MTSKMDSRPGAAICRCCFAEGCYKDISTEYFWMGKREVYAEMLSETFDVTISYLQSGAPNSQTRLICEPCIARLRDASDFKRQVLECEKTFLLHLDGSALEVPVEPLQDEKDVKLERVKVEVKLSDDEFDNSGFPDADDDDDDDMDDEPLMKLASKTPKKESVDIMDLLDNKPKPKPEKRKAVTITKVKVTGPSPPKKIKKTVPTPKATTSKVKPSTSKKAPAPVEKKKRAQLAPPSVKKDATKCDRVERNPDPARRNAHLILQYTTAYPFRVNGKSIVCVYCNEVYEDPDTFRPHMDQEHSTFNLKVAFHDLPKSEFVKADVTSLRCRICLEQCQDLDAVAKHLHENHEKPVNFDEKLGVMPYLLQKDLYNCAVCSKNVPSLFHLNRHTVTHFLSFVCHVCGSSYIASTGLIRHVRSKHQEYQETCNICRKVFPNMDAKEKHRRTEKTCMPYTCTMCPERFPDYPKRKKHMEVEHGNEKKVMKCPTCDISFARQGAYYEHFKLQHSSDAIVCKHCGLKFLSVYKLKKHIKRHSM